MKIIVNGSALEYDGAATVAALVGRLGLSPPRIAVELNEALVRRTAYEATALHEGDRIEIVTLVGGG